MSKFLLEDIKKVLLARGNSNRAKTLLETSEDDDSGVTTKDFHGGSHPDFPDSIKATDIYHKDKHIGTVITKSTSGRIPGGFGSGYHSPSSLETRMYEKTGNGPHGKSGGYSELFSGSTDWHNDGVADFIRRLKYNVKKHNRAKFW